MGWGGLLNLVIMHTGPNQNAQCTVVRVGVHCTVTFDTLLAGPPPCPTPAKGSNPSKVWSNGACKRKELKLFSLILANNSLSPTCLQNVS